MNNSVISICRSAVGVAFALLATPFALADHLPEHLFANGAPDTVLCGLDAYSTPVKDIVARLGEADRIETWDKDPVNATFHWQKGQLRIEANTYRVEGYADKPPVYLEVSGKDREGLCVTGRGLKLGDPVATVRKLYGARYGSRRTGPGKRTLMLQWPDGSTLYVRLAGERVESIHADGAID